MSVDSPEPSLTPLLGGLVVALLLVSSVPLVASQEVSTTASALPPLGMSMNAIGDLTSAGAPPRFGSFWVGPWMATSGWGGLDNALRTAKSTGTTPVIYWYYWGDSISPSCVDNGCDGRSYSQWMSFTDTLANRIKTEMGGAETLVVLENEFNKGGITGTYAPTFDTHLETVAKKLKTVPGVKLVLGFGAWGENEWTKFPKAAAQSEYIGFQMMRAQTRDSEASYKGASDRITFLTNHVAQKFNKPSFLYDLALSSYPDAYWQNLQAQELDDIFRTLQTTGATGLQGVVYRTLIDNPNMDPKNYYGYAEQHWGLKKAYGAGDKPSWAIWKQYATAPTVPPAPPAPNVPGTFEGEAMTTKANGIAFDDASASGARAWLLWANGDMRQTLVADGAQTLRLTVTAKGDLAEGKGPTMEIRLDGALLATHDVATTTWTPYTTDVALPNGTSTLSLVFTNDAIVNGQDRNLRVDRIALATVPAPTPVNRAPTAAFTVSGANLSWAFDASASNDPDGDALTYAWNFSDGTTATGTQVAREFPPGTHTATLTVSDGSLTATSNATFTAVRPNRAPTADFTVSGANLSWVFDASASNDPDGDALTYAWNFSDGTTATGTQVAREFPPGTHTVTLTVSDGALDTTMSREVTASAPNRAPSATFTTQVSDLVASFDASGSTDPDGDALVFSWDLGDGNVASGMTITHAFARDGTYPVQLTVSDGQTTESATQMVTVAAPNRSPVASFTVSGTDQTYTFDASASSDPDGDALHYAWDFGNGATATGVRVERTFVPGTFPVKLTVSDARGLSASETRTITATAPPAPPATGSLELEAFERKDNGIVFTDSGASDGRAWLLWGDGAITQTFQPAAGSYRVDIVAKGDYAEAWPEMELRADGVLVAQWTVASSSWATYGATMDFGTSPKVLTIHFTNDYYAKGVGDRNLRLDVLRLSAAPKVLTFEAESFAQKDNGMKVARADASGGAEWMLWTNGSMAQSTTLGTGTWQISVRARGDACYGNPMLEVRVDGVRVGKYNVATKSYTTYTASPVTLADGNHVVSLHFTNDFVRRNVCDRNLRLDSVTLTATG